MTSAIKQAIEERINEQGTAVVWVKRRGAECPCITQTGAGGRYNKKYHDANPSVEDCRGLKIVDVTTTRVALRGVWVHVADVADWSIMLVGEYQEGDRVLVVAPGTDDVPSLEQFEDETDELEIDNGVYTLLWFLEYQHGGEQLFVYGLCQEMESKSETAI